MFITYTYWYVLTRKLVNFLYASEFSPIRGANDVFHKWKNDPSNQNCKRCFVTCEIWSAICFKIMRRYTCGFFPRILAIIPATRYTCVFCHVYLRFIPKDMIIFLQTRIYMRTKKPIYTRYKQGCGIWVHRKSSYKRHRIIPSAKNRFMYDGAEK